MYYWYNLRSRRINAGTSISSGIAIGAGSSISGSATGSGGGGISRKSDDPELNPLLKSDSVTGAGIGAGGGGGAFSKTIGSVYDEADADAVARRANCGRLSRWNPVAITVIFTVSFNDSFITTPKLICASSLAVAVRISEQASFTSCRLSLLEPVMLMSTPRAPLTPPSSINGELIAWRAASMDAFSPDADAVPIIA